jgi:tetratricopeptide (TPR) repeat protein
MTVSASDRNTGPPDPKERHGAVRVRTALLLAIVLLTLVAYWPVKDNGFLVLDDEPYITENAAVKSGLTVQGIVLAFSGSRTANWHPLTWISHMADVQLFGLDPRGHHAVGVCIHTATALLLFQALLTLSGSRVSAFLVALLFAVHPQHVESVAWAAERKDLLSAFFWVLTLLTYARYARRPGGRRMIPVLLSFALGLLSKPMVVTLPLVLVLLDFWPLGRHRLGVANDVRFPWRQSGVLLREKVPLLVLSFLTGLVAISTQTSAGAIGSLESFPPAMRAANAILSPVLYLAQAAWPVNLAIYYPFSVRHIADARAVAAGALLAALTTGAVLQWRRRPWLLVGWLWFGITLLPVVGLIQVGKQAMADRYMYLPSVGIFIVVAWSLAQARLPRGNVREALLLAAGVACALLIWLTRRQVAYWRDDETLCRHAISVTRNNWVAMYGLAMQREKAGDLAEGLQLYRESLRINPNQEYARLAIARILQNQGRPAEALAELRAATAALPRSGQLLQSLAFALRAQGNIEESAVALRAAIATPGRPELRPMLTMMLAMTLADAGQTNEALAQLRELISLFPDFPAAYNNLAALLAQRGELVEAQALLRRALKIDPGYSDARKNLETLTHLAGTSQPSQGSRQ